MNLRLLPWAAMALLVLLLAVRPSPPGEGGASSPDVAPATNSGGPEIVLEPVAVRELRDDGKWNRLEAEWAVYGYASRTIAARGVSVSLEAGAGRSGGDVHAPSATWDLDGKSIDFPQGGLARREGGWNAELSAASLDLARKILRVPGPARLEGPGVTVSGKNLAWQWEKGILTMDAPKSRIEHLPRPRRKG